MKLIALNFVSKINVNRNNKRASSARLSGVYCRTDFNFSYHFGENDDVILEGSRHMSI